MRSAAVSRSTATGCRRPPHAGALYRVVYNDQLGKLAETVYGHAAQKQMILDANPTVTDADQIYVGQILYLPPPPAAESAAVALA